MELLRFSGSAAGRERVGDTPVLAAFAWYDYGMDFSDFSIVYLIQRFFYRIFDFFHHWYIDGSRAIGRRFMATIEAADRSLALKVTVRHFFEPLYKDYTIIGRILGLVFRTCRVIIGLITYLFIAAFFIAVYLAWIAIPFLIFYYAAKTY